jgi:L-2-hydroxyglutarate oxidase
MTRSGATINGTKSRPRYKIAVIGGGIVGISTAMALMRRFRPSLIVVEAEARMAAHQTGNNSGVIHSGLYYKPGSLKARLCTEGRDAMYAFCREHGVPFERCGKLVVATDESELPALDELERRGRANGLAGMRRLPPAEIREHEPHAAGIAGLHVPETGIVDYGAVTRAMAGEITRLGGEISLDTRVTGVRSGPEEIVLETTQGAVKCDGLINCGGLQSDRVARMCGVDPQVRIVPFRGEYYQLSERGSGLVRNLIYPVPDPKFPFLGVHFTRMIRGGVEAGPNAVLSLARHGYRRISFDLRDSLSIASYSGFWRMAQKHWRTGCRELHRSMSKRAFLRSLQRLVPALELRDLEPGGAGVRAQAVSPSGALLDDFAIVQSARAVHVLNAPSPAATASIAIGEHIAGLAAATFNLGSFAHAAR